jgi:hypothetical protein
MVKDINDTKKKMLESLEFNLGIVSTSCNAVNIHRSTHYRWLKEDEEYKQRVFEIQEATIDHVERILFDKINEKDTTSIIFYLKSKAKHRGYVERQQVEVADTKEFTVKVIE